MALWKKLWLVFAVIWVVVAGLQAFTLLAFGEDAERDKALQPIVYGIAVPAGVYLLAWLWSVWRRRQGRVD